MPSTRRQKAKARKSREMDMLSDIENMDVMLGNGSNNPIERELVDAIEQSSVQGDIEANNHRYKEILRRMNTWEISILVFPMKIIFLDKTT